MQTAQSKIVRAIDVGYGNTKFVAYHNHGSEIQCFIFISSMAPHRCLQLPLGILVAA